MKQLVPNLIVRKNIKIEKLRELPIKGKVNVQLGDIVESEKVVLEAELPGDLLVIRLAEKLSITPEYIINNLKIKVDQKIKKGDVLFLHQGLFGLFKTEVKSPIDGVIEFITQKTAHIGIRGTSKPIKINSYINGKIIDIIEEKAVLIETSASFLQGIFGVGGERQGVLQSLNIPNSKILEVSDVPGNANNLILFGGSSPSIQVLDKLKEAGVVGLITASIDDETLEKFINKKLEVSVTGDENIPFTLIVTEGFGNLSFGEKHLEVLKLLEGKMASINGATQVRAGAVRPEIIVSNTELQEDSRNEEIKLTIGKKVKIIRHPFFGQTAEVIELPEQPQILESGSYARVVTLKFDNGDIVNVPRANVEL